MYFYFFSKEKKKRETKEASLLPPPTGVPVDVCGHEVLPCRRRLPLIHVVELQLPVHALEPRQHNVLPHGRPEEGVAGPPLERCQLGHLLHPRALLRVHGVERHVRFGPVPVHDGEAVPSGLPRKLQNLLVLVLQLENLEADEAGSADVSDPEV